MMQFSNSFTLIVIGTNEGPINFEYFICNFSNLTRFRCLTELEFTCYKMHQLSEVAKSPSLPKSSSYCWQIS